MAPSARGVRCGLPALGRKHALLQHRRPVVNGKALAFDAKDRCSPVKDLRSGAWIYERDVVQRLDEDGSWVVCWDGNEWELRRVDDPRISLPLPEAPLRVVGHTALGLLERLRSS